MVFAIFRPVSASVETTPFTESALPMERPTPQDRTLDYSTTLLT
jgi:hypothetical protein